uniref:WRKY transcription factor WRKY24 n=1 Tax=Oryza meridionalis TaxID=40149 RepID=A0A0E0DF81_9ORYZ
MTTTTATLDPPPPPLLIAGSLLDDDRDAGSVVASFPRWLPSGVRIHRRLPSSLGRGGEAATRRRGSGSFPDDDVGATMDGGGDAAVPLPMAMTTATTTAPTPVEAAADGGGEPSSAGGGGQQWRCIFFLFAEMFFYRRVNLLHAKILSAYKNHLFSQALACREDEWIIEKLVVIAARRSSFVSEESLCSVPAAALVSLAIAHLAFSPMLVYGVLDRLCSVCHLGEMEGDIAMEEWKESNHRGADYLMTMPMQNFLADAFPPPELLEGEGGAVGFEKHGLSVAVGSPPPPEDGCSPLPLTPQFGSGGGGGSLADRRARGGFSNVARISVPYNQPAAAAADVSSAGAPSPYVTIPPGLSPTTLLESPVFFSNAMGQASPTTGKLHMLGGANDSNPIRFESPPIEEGSGAFSFKPLNLASSHYAAAEKTKSLPNNQHQSLPISVKTEATSIQTAQDEAAANQLMQPQFNGGKLSRAAPDNGGDGECQPAEGDAKGDSSSGAVAVVAAAAAAAAVAEDGYSWRKYGQKQVKHSEYPRSYYKCTHASCAVKKKVERSHEGHVTEIIYKGTHNHPKPAASRRPPVHPPPPPTTTTPTPTPLPPGDAQADHAPDGGGGSTPAGAGQAGAEWHNGGVVGGEGLDATSSPSVPGELCESTASMQVHDGAAAAQLGESPEGVDVTSAVSDEVDRDDKAAHVLPLAGGVGVAAAADDESDELERKRRKLDSCATMDMSTASRAVREPRVVIQTTSEVDILDDGYRWRKYGQKVVKGNPNPRSYYKCTHPGCLVRKHVERASHDLKSVITTYEGKHNHEVPAARNSGHPAGSAPPGGGGAGSSSQPHGVGVGGRRPEVPSVQESLMRLGGGCGAAPFPPHFGLHLPPPPPRDPLAPMSNFPYSLGHAPSPALRGLPPPPSPPPSASALAVAGLGGVVEGLKYPMLAPPSVHSLLRHRQGGGMEAVVVPKAEVKQEAMPPAAAAAVAGAGRSAAVYQQAMSRVSLGNQL